LDFLRKQEILQLKVYNTKFTKEYDVYRGKYISHRDYIQLNKY
jgi:hypothetical protein